MCREKQNETIKTFNTQIIFNSLEKCLTFANLTKAIKKCVNRLSKHQQSYCDNTTPTSIIRPHDQHLKIPKVH